MSRQLRVLNIEDSETDSLQLVTELLRGDYELDYERVYTPEDMNEALTRREWDIIIADYSMPNFTGLDALKILQKHELDLPFILVSGAIGEEKAVTALKAGAHDFIGKDNYARLLPAIERELRDAEVRRSRRKTEEELKVSEEKFRAIASTANDAIIIIDSDCTVSFWNPGAEEIFGYSNQEAIGKELHKLIIPERDHDDYLKSFSAFIEIMASVGERRASGRTRERIVLRKDGKEFPIEFSNSAVLIKGQWHTVEIIRDISERKQLETQLRQSQKMEAIGTLASGIAHEINTPTQFIGDNINFFRDAFGGFSDLLMTFKDLLDKAKGGRLTDVQIEEAGRLFDQADLDYLREEIPVAIQQSLDGIQRVTSIVRAMRDFAHPGPEEKTPLDLNNAINSTITVARNEWKYVADIETDFDSTLPLVPCIAGEFNQIMLNIIVNAAHAITDVVGDGSEGKGKIKITTGRDGGSVMIRISDTGSGIPEAIRNRIFDPFFTTKDVGKGTGQGLSIAHSVIVEKHGGNIYFETEEGKGTTFIIQLPLDEQETEAN